MTIDEAQQKIIAEFGDMDDWLDKYQHLVHLAREHPSDDNLRRPDHALPGCQSQVWIRSEMHDGTVHFFADSDSRIVQGILVLLLRVLNDQPPADIAAADLYFLRETGLETNLSPTRANGVATIVRHLQQSAELHAPTSESHLTSQRPA
jgi:cysteine desulfuration protein SufE